MKKITFFFLFILAFQKVLGTTWNVGTSGFSFSPANTTIVFGDNVSFVLGSGHDVVEVSMSTYNANGTAPLNGGFSIPLSGSGTITSTKLTVGTHYFVCTPHVASFNMKGTIVVMNSGCTIPSKPLSINGNTPVCPNSANTYSVATVADATSYTWTLPAGWIGNSTTNSINTTAGASGGNITVTANNSCGSSTATLLAVAISGGPAQPGAISGSTSICFNSSNIYSVTAVPGASSYTWTLPNGWSGSSTSNSITATSGSNSGTVSVTANNTCASSVARTLSVTNSGPPNQPGSITGNNAVCSNTSNAYSVSAVQGATTYTWTLPAGWSGNSNSNSISTTSGNSGGNITVSANSPCGSSISQVLAVTTASVPTQPASISGNVSVCANSTNNYSITAVPGATTYTWTLPSGWTGSSTTNSINATAGASGGNISVTANNNNACGSSLARSIAVTTNGTIGQPGAIAGNTTACTNVSVTYTISAISGATSYTWTLPSGWTGTSTTNSITATTGSTGGNITVVGNSTCGNSVPQALMVTTTPIPAQPGSITGNISVCANSTNTYSIAAVPDASTYSWTLPTGWTGSSTTNSINATAGANGGNISVIANNACGSSQIRSMAVNTNGTIGQPGAIAGNTTVCANASASYNISPVSGATSYTWTLPSGWTGTSATNSITATAGATGGNITVFASSTCGNSSIQTLSVTTTTSIAQPSAISGKTSVCANSSNEYSVPAVVGATSYTWTLPVGWSGNSSTNTIITLSGANSGNITVSANSSCGSSAVQTMSITVNPAPLQPTGIIGNTIVCPNSINDYNVVEVPGASFYTWIMPVGWTINSTSNSITTMANTTGGTITVSANNSCGLSPKQSLSVQINQVNKTINQSGSTLTAAATGVTYQWINCATKTPIAGQTNQSFVASGIGSYAVIIKQNNCTDTSSCIALTTVPDSDINFRPRINIYPNPSRGKINIDVDRIENTSLEVYNALGERIYKTSLTSLKSEVDLSKEIQGVYFISIYLANSVLTKKLIIQ